MLPTKVDTETDPGEMKNLAVDAGKKVVLEECRARRGQWYSETSDAFQIPQG
jgi:hypothetical protein